MRRRGGRLTVIDPARTRTAELADRHLAPRPGTDAALLFAIVHVLFDEGLVADDLGGIAEHVTGLDEVRALADDFAPEVVAEHCGVAAHEIRALAREIAAAPTAAVYGRIGTSTVEFGTLGSWLVDVVNILTGNLDRPGGAMFPLGADGTGPATRPARPRLPHRTLAQPGVRATPKPPSELPAAALAEEIDTPGDGQIRALITIAGNPVLSAPTATGCRRALDGVDFMLSVDPYLNETTRHADVILPPPPPSQSPHFDFALNNLAVRNNARYSPPVLPLTDGRPDEAEILSRIALICLRAGPGRGPGTGRRAGDHRDADQGDRRPALAGGRPPGRRIGGHAHRATRVRTPAGHDAAARPYGDGSAPIPTGSPCERLKAAPHGIDLGPLQPRLPRCCAPRRARSSSPPGRWSPTRPGCAPRWPTRPGDGLVLIGRRHLRSNNSWMHNLPALAGGTNRCTLQMHPDDAAALGHRRRRGRQGCRRRAGGARRGHRRHPPGVVSLPHGWGHDQDGTRLGWRPTQPGVNVNQLNDGSTAGSAVGHRRAQRHPAYRCPAAS